MAGTEDVGRSLALVSMVAAVRAGPDLLSGVGQGHLGVVHVKAPHDGIVVVVLDRRAGGAGGRRTGTGTGAAGAADEGLPFGTVGSAELEEVGGRGTGARARAAIAVETARGTAATGLPTIGGRGTGSASGGGSIGHLNIFGRRRRRGGEVISWNAAARLVADAAAHGIEEVGYDHHCCNIFAFVRFAFIQVWPKVRIEQIT